MESSETSLTGSVGAVWVPPECLLEYIRQLWRVRDKLRLVDMVPILRS